jgi:hypothetical protein
MDVKILISEIITGQRILSRLRNTALPVMVFMKGEGK